MTSILGMLKYLFWRIKLNSWFFGLSIQLLYAYMTFHIHPKMSGGIFSGIMYVLLGY